LSDACLHPGEGQYLTTIVKHEVGMGPNEILDLSTPSGGMTHKSDDLGVRMTHKSDDPRLRPTESE